MKIKKKNYMSIASKLGKYSGIIVAESIWLFECGFKAGATYYVANASIKSIKTISKIATQHAIDSGDPEKVTENIFNCLEFVD